MPGTSTPTVILIHGIWMNRYSMAFLARAFKRAGFDVVNFQYRFLTQHPNETLSKLREVIIARESTETYIVGHSMGGLFALSYFSQWADENIKAMVLLGSSIKGSQTARIMSGNVLGRIMLGKSREFLVGSAAEVRSIPVGVVAGDVALGLTRLFNRLQGPSDGPVALSETQADWLSDHIVLHRSHTGMLFSSDVFQQTLYFFKHGQFDHTII